MDQWTLAIDFGTSFTAAAMRVGDRRPEILTLDGESRMPSLVLLNEDGELVVGRNAENQADINPERVVRTPKEDVGHGVMPLAGNAVKVTDAVGKVLGTVHDEALRQRGNAAPQTVWLTHPAAWEQTRQQALKDAAASAGIAAPELIPEPVAAAIYYAGERLEPGQYVAVYDLGGGTFDTAVLRRTEDGFELAGPPGGNEVAGEDFDHRLYLYLGEQLPPDEWKLLTESSERKWKSANFRFKTEVRKAKVALSTHNSFSIFVPGVDRDLRITRPEFQQLIRKDIAATIEELNDTISKAGLKPEQVSAIYLVGGSSRIPLVAQLMKNEFGDLVKTWDDPKTVVALGATLAPPPPVKEKEVTEEKDTTDLVTKVVTPTNLDDGPAGRPEPGPETHERKRPKVLLIAGALVVVALAIIAAVTMTGDGDTGRDIPIPSTGSDPTTAGDPTPDDGLTTEEQALLEHVPVEISAGGCVSDQASVDQGATFSEEVYAAIICEDAGRGATSVQYWEYYDNQGMYDEYYDTMNNRGLVKNQGGNCGEVWPGEHQYDVGEVVGGRVICWTDQDFNAFLFWTDEATSIYSIAINDTRNEIGLFKWWSRGDNPVD